MSEVLRAGRPAAAELARILRAQIRTARAFLPTRGAPGDEAIHELRRSLKRARATLRLLRPVLRQREYHSVNFRLRDAARSFNAVRDARVLLDALESLTRSDEALATIPARTRLSAELQIEREATLRTLAARRGTAAGVRRALRELDARIRDWRLPRTGLPILRTALRRLHADARRACQRARQQRSDTRLHEWRKQVKHEGHALGVIAGTAGSRLAAAAEDAERIGRHLGEDHDLALLDGRLAAMTGRALRATVLRRAIRARRRVLQRRALNLAAVLYDRKPRAFVHHLGL